MAGIKTLTINGVKYTIVDEQAQEKIGDLSELETSEKSSLVKAINEAAGSGGLGGSGEDGGYYTPVVTEEGVLSWTPSKATMPEVAATDIVQAVLAALPDGDEVAY